MICKQSKYSINLFYFYDLYSSETKECVAIDAREAAPSGATQRMFVDGNPPPSSTYGKYF
jgi:gamma-glutamyltranspeptidase